jgi:tripartite-type tricarboxylate transporter receptor subunit TctC
MTDQLTDLAARHGRISRRMLLAAPAIMALAGRRAAAYPVRQATLVVPYAAGGTADIVARLVAQELQQRLGIGVVVENKGGAAGTLGCAAVAKAAPDGATLLFTAGGPLTIGPHLSRNVPYQAATSFTPLALVCQVPSLLVVNAADPAKTTADLVARGRGRPDTLRFGSPGVGTSVHLIAELFRLQAGFAAVHVPYRGGALAMNDLIAGQIDYMFENVPQLLPQVTGGTLRALAVTGSARLASAPAIPTLAESGVGGVEVGTWYGLLGPRGLPEDVAAQLAAGVAAAGQSADFTGRLADQGAQVELRLRSDFAGFMAEDDRRWQDTIARAGIKAE